MWTLSLFVGVGDEACFFVKNRLREQIMKHFIFYLKMIGYVQQWKATPGNVWRPARMGKKRKQSEQKDVDSDMESQGGLKKYITFPSQKQ